MLPQGLGLCIPWQGAESDPGYYQRVLDKLDPPCWYNHKFDGHGDICYPMLWKASTAEQCAPSIIAADWENRIALLGNEPERSDQSNDTPEQFADGVLYWNNNIRRSFAVPGILWSDEGNMWWNAYKQLGAPEPDAYHIHIYAYHGNDWKRQLGDALRVFNDKPLIISECGGWFVTPDKQEEIMREAMSAIWLKRIPAAFWFSAHYGTWKPYWLATDCLDRDENITEVGEAYKAWAHKTEHKILFPVLRG